MKGREMDFNKAYSAKSNGKMFNNGNSKNNNGSLYKNDVENKFNWGAFFLTWIWGIFNKSYITLIIFPAILLSLIPIIGTIIPLGLSIWFGIRGNKWAWENGNFSSIASFHAIQKKWAIAGLIVTIVFTALSIFAVVATISLPSLMTDTSAQVQKVQTRKACNVINEAAQMNKALGNSCEGTSQGLASCFAESIQGVRLNNVLSTNDTNWEFHGDGSCIDETSCWVNVTLANKMTLKIPIVLEDGYAVPLVKDIYQSVAD